MGDQIHQGNPYARYDLQIEIVSPVEQATLPTSEKNALFKKPNISDKKAKQAGSVARSVPVAVTATGVDTELSLAEIGDGYSEIIDRANALLERLRERAGGLVYEFDPKARPDLASAVVDIFQGESRRITYNMYLEALRLDKDIAIAIGEESHGIA